MISRARPRALLDATPRLDSPPGPLPALPGRPPDLRTPVTGCAFAARCPRATDLCGREIPAPRAGVACHPPRGAAVMTAVLEVRALCRRYAEVSAVEGVSFNVPADGALGIGGGSGSGKTTTARIVTGLERADAGEVLVRGRVRGPAAKGRAARLRRAREVQLVFQDPLLSLDPRVAAGEVLRETLRLHFPGRDPRPRVRELLDSVPRRR